MSSTGVKIKVVWWDWREQCFDVVWWRVVLREEVPLLVINLEKGLRYEFPIERVRLWEVDSRERLASPEYQRSRRDRDRRASADSSTDCICPTDGTRTVHAACPRHGIRMETTCGRAPGQLSIFDHTPANPPGSDNIHLTTDTLTSDEIETLGFGSFG